MEQIDDDAGDIGEAAVMVTKKIYCLSTDAQLVRT